MSLARQNIVYNQRGVISKQNQNRKLVVGFLVLLIILFSVLYMLQANSAATQGYKIRGYKNELSKIQSDNQAFELKLSEIRSLDSLKKRAETLDMVKISGAEYLSPTSRVAAK